MHYKSMMEIPSKSLWKTPADLHNTHILISSCSSTVSCLMWPGWKILHLACITSKIHLMWPRHQQIRIQTPTAKHRRARGE